MLDDLLKAQERQELGPAEPLHRISVEHVVWDIAYSLNHYMAIIGDTLSVRTRLMSPGTKG